MELTFTNYNEESVRLTKSGTFRILDINGIGQVDGDVQTVKGVYQDGVTHLDTLLDARYITIDVGIFADNRDQLYQHRRTLSRVFNPKLKAGTLHAVFGIGERVIAALPENTVDFPTSDSGERFQRATIDLICPNPFWLSLQSTTKPMSNLIGGLRFPLKFSGRSVPFAKRGTRIILENDGDVASPVEITFKGEGANPIVTNKTTGEFIKVNRTLSTGEKLIINTAYGKKRVEIEDAEGNRTNAFNWIDLRSSFFQLVTGENEIEYNTDDGTARSSVQIHWRNRYLGI